MMRGGLTAVETSGKIAMGVLAFHRIAPRIFQEMHRSRSIYFATSTLRSICHTTAPHIPILRAGASCHAQFPDSI
jgi:hypothetical protein